MKTIQQIWVINSDNTKIHKYLPRFLSCTNEHGEYEDFQFPHKYDVNPYYSSPYIHFPVYFSENELYIKNEKYR